MTYGSLQNSSLEKYNATHFAFQVCIYVCMYLCMYACMSSCFLLNTSIDGADDSRSFQRQVQHTSPK